MTFCLIGVSWRFDRAPHDAALKALQDEKGRGVRIRVERATDAPRCIDVSMQAPNVVDAMEYVEGVLKRDLPNNGWVHFQIGHEPL